MLLNVSLMGRADAMASSLPLPLYSSALRAGFPSPEDNQLDADRIIGGIVTVIVSTFLNNTHLHWREACYPVW